jgi:toxin ParE1/3/4
MEIRWSPETAEDFERVVRRIQCDNLNCRKKVADTIRASVANLKIVSHLGRIGRIDGTRELLFPSLPYIVDGVKRDAVEIARIYRAAEDWP